MILILRDAAGVTARCIWAGDPSAGKTGYVSMTQAQRIARWKEEALPLPPNAPQYASGAQIAAWRQAHLQPTGYVEMIILGDDGSVLHRS